MAKDELVNLSDELVTIVKTLFDEYDKEDRDERSSIKPLWTKLENYFEGLQRIYFDYGTKDWKSVDQDPKTKTNRHYDKIINIYRAHCESIVAALSIKPPSAIFYPDDAEVQEDIVTAKVCNKLKEDIERFNNATLLIIKSLIILFNQGTVAAYIYNRSNSKYGTYTTPKYGESQTRYTTLLNCPECGTNLDEVVSDTERVKVPDESRKCEVCGYDGISVQEEYDELVPTIVGSSIEAKSKTIIEPYSPLFCYIPFYARKQEDCPYLRLRFEQHYSIIKNMYPKLKKKGFQKSIDNDNAEDRRLFVNATVSNLCTVDCWWIRNWAFDLLDGVDDKIKELKKKYPDGFYAVVIDDELVEIHNEDLDDHWEISTSPLSANIHGSPIGKSLAPIQELENEIVDLQIETLEHSIPETWARPDVVNFSKYSKSRAAPGMMYPTLPAADPGETLGSAFHSIKTATLSEESDIFLRRLDEKAQFVSASFPSIYGGPATSGSKTAREYTESRSMALQRLSLSWNTLKFWWAGVMSKAVPLRMHSLRQSGNDEKIVEKNKTGFVNTWIRQSELEGKIGRVEADADENMPLSPSQLKSVVMELMALKDTNIAEALYHPNNTPLITKILSAPDFYIPGSDDRDKQYAEFADLLAGIEVEVNPSVDNNALEAETCRSFLVSPTGLMIKRSNPEGWSMIESHMLMHKEAAMMMPPSTLEGVEDKEGAMKNG
jgi:hypothetical protein